MRPDILTARRRIWEELFRFARLHQKDLRLEEALAFLECWEEHEGAFPFIEQYDRGQLEVVTKESGEEYVLKTKTATEIIASLKLYLSKRLSERGESAAHFGAPNAGNLDTVISGLYQTFDEKELYPSTENKAANLLYLLVKDHCFVDGNKRIAAFLFVWYLHMNGMLYPAPSVPVISYPLLYKLTVFIAESDPKHKDLIVDLVSKIVSFSNEVPPEDFWHDSAPPTPEDKS